MNFNQMSGRRLKCESLEKRVLLAAEIGALSEDASNFVSANLWADAGPIQAPLLETSTSVIPELSPIKAQEFRLLTVNRNALSSAVDRDQLLRDSRSTVSVPRPDGAFDEFLISSTSILPPALAAKFPSINTFAGVSTSGNGDRLVADLTPNGFHAMVLSTEGNYYVDPFYYFDDRLYASYFASGDFLARETSVIGGDDVIRAQHDHSEVDQVSDAALASESATANRSGTHLRTYRTAVAATGEYTAFHGGTIQAGLAAVTTAINRVSGVYESELSIRLELVPTNDLLIYTNAATDPYTNNDGFALLAENQSTIDSVIGNANYDLGHVFGTGGGGLAGLGVAGIDGAKAEGQTGDPNPINDSFYIDYVAHEIGHQFGGDHTFNGDSGACASNANSSTAYEPGSGSTIQAYAGLCGDDDLQNNSDAYFHSVSFDQMIAHVDGVIPTVGTRTETGNVVPQVDGGRNYTIPAATPFTLTATGSDGNGDTLTYNWEQRDLGPQRDVNAPDNGQGPLFRSWTPTTDPSRTFPRMQDLLAGTTVVGEQLATTNRSLNFRVTARDNRAGGGGVATDDVRIMVVDTGQPFQVNEPNATASWPAYSRQNVTWDVAGTSGGNINATTVDILLSTNSGQTFDVVLASSVSNIGSHEILVPDLQTTTARIKVQASRNVFFDISDSDFTIEQPGITRDFGDAPAPYPTLSADDGPFHVVGGPVLGLVSDAEIDGQPSLLADGDGADEDGLSIPEPLVAGQTGVFTVSTATGGQLEMYIDFNGNGVFDNTFLEVVQRTLPPGIHDITVSIPSGAPETTLVRLRISTAGGLGPTGFAMDGEVEDHLVQIYQTPPLLDFGDAPESYGTLTLNGGPRHVVENEFRLGNDLDGDDDGQASAMATGEGRDDDGIIFQDLLIPGNRSSVNVTASAAGVLDYFFDFDADGVFGNSISEVFSAPVSSGSQTLSFDVPNDASIGATMARFRFSELGGLGPGGIAFNGEVEDYQVLVAEDTRDRLLHNFDSVQVPVLPPAWVSSQENVVWATEAGTGESQSSAAVVASPGFVSDVTLDSPPFFVEIPDATVRFQNWFDTEEEFDGGVLEISIDGSLYQDIVLLGGVFLSGGYTGTIDTAFQNPLAGRQAWTGNSNGFVDTTVKLPPSTVGQDVSLRWRFGSDASVGTGGWRIDSIRFDGPALQFDFGDAPDLDGSETGSSTVDSPAHVLSSLWLGATVDADFAGLPTADADGDDRDGADDEDGVVFPANWSEGENAITVRSSEDAILNLWIDLDADGFDSSGDHLLKDIAVDAGTNVLIVELPELTGGVLAPGAVARVRLSHQAGLSHDGLAGDGEVEDHLVGSDRPSPVHVESLQINDGSEQRSQVTSLTVTFDGETDVSPDAFSVVNRANGSAANTSASVSIANGKTMAVITFTEGDNVTLRPSGNSLVDGNFVLLIDQSGVPRMEDDYRFGEKASDAFFRLFGDSDGDRDVDGQDFGNFGLSFLKSSADPGFDSSQDADGDGDVDGQDYGRFGLQFLQTLPF